MNYVGNMKTTKFIFVFVTQNVKEQTQKSIMDEETSITIVVKYVNSSTLIKKG